MKSDLVLAKQRPARLVCLRTRNSRYEVALCNFIRSASGETLVASTWPATRRPSLRRQLHIQPDLMLVGNGGGQLKSAGQVRRRSRLASCPLRIARSLGGGGEEEEGGGGGSQWSIA